MLSSEAANWLPLIGCLCKLYNLIKLNFQSLTGTVCIFVTWDLIEMSWKCIEVFSWSSRNSPIAKKIYVVWHKESTCLDKNYKNMRFQVTKIKQNNTVNWTPVYPKFLNFNTSPINQIN